MASSDDWVETRTYNLTARTGKQYIGTIDEIHLAYKGDSSKGVKYEYEYGVVKSKQFIGINYKEAERGIDENTGLIKWERDPNGFGADYSYDNLLRLTKITPTQGEAAEYIWYPVEGGYTKRIEYGRGYNPDPTGENHTLGNLATHKVFHFDGLGRLIKSKEIMADGSYSVVEKAYDPNGREFFVSEPFADNTVGSEYLYYGGGTTGYKMTLRKKTGNCYYGTISTIYSGNESGYSCGDSIFQGTIDPLGRVRRVIKPDGSYTDTSYDGFDYTVTLHGIEGTGDSSTTYQMDAFGRLIHVLPPAGTDAVYSYDSQDRLINVDLSGQIRTYEYDPLGFLRKSNNPENGLVTIDSYDVWGNIVKYQDANGTQGGYQIINEYDAKGRIKEKQKATFIGLNATQTKILGTWVYDQYSGTDAYKNRLRYAVGFDGTTSASIREDYTYAGPNGRISNKAIQYSLQAVDQALPINSYNFKYEYDNFGQLTEEKLLYGDINLAYIMTAYNHGFTIDKYFNDKNGVHGLTYHPGGALNEVKYGTNSASTVVTTTMMIESNTSRLKNIAAEHTGANPWSWNTGDYSYDGAGNIKSIGTGAMAQTFAYDALSRLVNAKVIRKSTTGDSLLPAISYAYDDFGNLEERKITPNPNLPEDFLDSINIKTDISQTETGVTDNRIARLYKNGDIQNPLTPSYDLNGNITSLDGITSTYDSRNYLRTTSGMAGNKSFTDTYLYDSSGERIAAVRYEDNKLESATYYFRSGSQVFAEETMTFNGNPNDPVVKDRIKSYLYLGGNLAATEENDVAISGKTYNITGTITCNGCENGTYLGGIKIYYGPDNFVLTTNAGLFTIPNLTSGSTYNVQPSDLSYTFIVTGSEADPKTFETVTITNKDETVAFTATPIIGGERSVSGKVTLNGAGLGNVTISSGTKTTTTDSSGNYTLTGFLDRAQITIYPTKENYAFTPSSITFTFGTIDVFDKNFTAAQQTTFSISGTIYYLGVGLRGATVTATGTGGVGGGTSLETDGSGRYTISGLPVGGYNLTAAAAGSYTFAPLFTQPVSVGPDKTGKDFSATGTFKISGYVKCGGVGLAGVPIGIEEGWYWTYSDSQGYYQFDNLASGLYHLMFAPKEGYSYNTNYLTIPVSGDTQAPLVIAYPTISGIVTRWGYGVEGVDVLAQNMDDPQQPPFTVNTGRSGIYSFIQLPAGNYQITATLEDHVITPSSQVAVLANVPATHIDFIAEPTGYYISGQIRKGDSTAGIIRGIQVTAGGQSDTTDFHGIYIIKLSAGGTYKVQPWPSGSYNEFDPPDQNVTLHNENHPEQGVDFYAFTGTPAYTVSGSVRLSGAGLPDVLVSLYNTSTGLLVRNEYTDLSGNYSLESIPNGSYYAEVKLYGYGFSPSTRTITVLHDHVYALDFDATLLPRYSVSGMVSLEGMGLEGVAVRADSTHMAVTDASGFYEIFNLPAGQYSLIPSRQGYVFTPTGLGLDLAQGDAEHADFSAWQLTYSISGYARTSLQTGSTPIPDVKVSIGDQSVFTDEDGYYEIPGFYPGQYNVAFYKAGYVFSANPLAVTVHYYDAVNSNTTGTYVGVGKILGTVSVGRTGPLLRGVKISTSLENGDTLTVYTDLNGNYLLDNLVKSQSYSVMAEIPGYTLVSGTKSPPITISATTQGTDLDFTATKIAGTYAITGHVTIEGVPTEGVQLIVADESGTIVRETASLSPDGWFTASGLPTGHTYTVTPVLAGYGFIPSKATVTLSGADQAIATPFDGTVLTYCIFGQVTDDKGVGAEGVSVNLDPVDPTPHMSTLTDSSGNYQFCDLANGRYWVTCKGGGHYFWTIVVNNGDVYGIDFQLEPPTETREESSGQGLIERKNAKAVKSKAGEEGLLNYRVHEEYGETSSLTREGGQGVTTLSVSPQGEKASGTLESSSGAVRYYIWDHLGTTRVVTDGNGNLISTHDYEPFGVEIPPLGGTGDITDLPSPNSHKFTGHERDQSTGYDYMHFRYYGSNIGRFMKPDNVTGSPLNPQNWNLYSYVRGNPVNMNDPTGHSCPADVTTPSTTSPEVQQGTTTPTGTDVKGDETKGKESKEGPPKDASNEQLKLMVDVTGLGTTAAEKGSVPKLSKAGLKAAEKYGLDATEPFLKTTGNTLGVISAVTDTIGVAQDFKHAKPTGTPISKEERNDLLIDLAEGIALTTAGALLEGPTIGWSSLLFIPGAAKIGTSAGRLLSPYLPEPRELPENTKPIEPKRYPGYD